MNISKILSWGIRQRLLNVPILPMQQTKASLHVHCSMKTICYIVLYDCMTCVLITVHKALYYRSFTHSAYNFDCSPIWISSINSKKLCDGLTFLWCIWKLGKATITFIVLVCLSICPHGTTQLPLNQFSWNLILEDL